MKKRIPKRQRRKAAKARAFPKTKTARPPKPTAAQRASEIAAMQAAMAALEKTLKSKFPRFTR